MRRRRAAAWVLLATLFLLSMAFLPICLQGQMVEAQNKSSMVGLGGEESSGAPSSAPGNASARQVPTGADPIHHNRAPFHHFL